MTSREEKRVETSIPLELYFAIVRLQGSEELEFCDACKRVALLIESEGEKFHRLVKVEANRQYKARHMRELNAARKTWQMKGSKAGFEDGKAVVYTQAESAAGKASTGDGGC